MYTGYVRAVAGINMVEYRSTFTSAFPLNSIRATTYADMEIITTLITTETPATKRLFPKYLSTCRSLNVEI